MALEEVLRKYINGTYPSLIEAAKSNGYTEDQMKKYIARIKNSNKLQETKLYESYKSHLDERKSKLNTMLETCLRDYINGTYITLEEAAKSINCTKTQLQYFIKQLKNSTELAKRNLYNRYLEAASSKRKEAKEKGGQKGKRTTTYRQEQIVHWYEMIVNENKSLSEIVNETGITKTVINENLNKYLSKEQLERLKKVYEQHKKHINVPVNDTTQHNEKNNKNLYKIIVNELLAMSPKEIEKYIQQKKPSYYVEKIKIFIKNEKDIKKREEVEELLKTVEQIAEEIKKRKIQETHERAIFLYDTMIQRGFFNTNEFIRIMHNDFELSVTEMKNILQNGRTILKNQYQQRWDEYLKKIQRNKIRYYILHQRQINDMLIRIKNQEYDIVDYYINFSMPSRVFIQLYRDLTETNIIQLGETATLNKFFNQYNALESNDSHNWSSANIDMLNGELISQSDRDIVDNIMQRYYIPKCYFKLCLKKYKNGEFDFILKKQI